MPLPLLINAIQNASTNDGVWENLESALTSMHYWSANVKLPNHIEGQRQNVQQLLRNHTSHMDNIVCGSRDNLGSQQYSKLLHSRIDSSNHAPDDTDGKGETVQEDPLLTLFVRVNVAGLARQTMNCVSPC